jgi:hypothetical protein
MLEILSKKDYQWLLICLMRELQTCLASGGPSYFNLLQLKKCSNHVLCSWFKFFMSRIFGVICSLVNKIARKIVLLFI